MRKLYKTIISIICFFLLNSYSCKKHITKPDNPYGLPNATQTGANIFAFRLDSVNKIFKRTGVKSAINARFKNDTMIIFTTLNLPATQEVYDIVIRFYKNAEAGHTYGLQDSTQVIFQLIGTFSVCKVNNFKPFYPKNGSVMITKLDTLDKIVSGSFNNVKIPIANCPKLDTINLTDGRFDINYTDN